MNLNKLYKTITKKILSHPSCTGNPKDSLLSLHEAATKLWVATATEKSREEVEKRISNTLIGVCDVANSLGVRNIEKIILRRIDELQKEKSLI